MKKTALPCQFAWTVPPSPAALARQKRAEERNEKSRLKEEKEKLNEIRREESTNSESLQQDLDLGMQVDVHSELVLQEIHTQTDPQPNHPTFSSHTQTEFIQGFTVEDFKSDPVGIPYYTGLQDYLTFFDVLASLGPCAFELKYMHGV